jgi:hypothetical protein
VLREKVNAEKRAVWALSAKRFENEATFSSFFLKIKLEKLRKCHLQKSAFLYLMKTVFLYLMKHRKIMKPEPINYIRLLIIYSNIVGDAPMKEHFSNITFSVRKREGVQKGGIINCHL